MVLGDHNIGRLLAKLSIPAIVGMLVMGLYNVVDAIFIGRSVGTLGIAGIAVAFPIQMIVGAIGQMIGIGGASLLSRSLGANDMDTANRTLGNVIASVLLLSVPISCLGLLAMDELLGIFGATPSILPYAKDYLLFILLGITFHSMAMALNNLVRAEGRAKIAMTTMILSAIMNILLDALFIFGLNMGVRGAAIATLVAYVSAFLFLLAYYISKKSVLRLRLDEIRFQWKIQREIISIGISAFVRQAAMSLLVIILNNTLARYGGDIAIAVYGVVMRLIMLVFTPILGISQGLQPIIGYNYGARNFRKAKESVFLATGVATLISVAGAGVMFLFPEALLGIFSRDRILLEQGRTALRTIILAFPLLGFHVVGITLFQATGKAFQTFLLTLSRQFIFLIPLVLTLPKFFQLGGIWISFPIADLLSAVMTVLLIIPLGNRYLKMASISVEESRDSS